MLTTCGIETKSIIVIWASLPWVATVLTACGIETIYHHTIFVLYTSVVTVLTVCGMRRRVRGSRGAKRRWGPHISSPWLKGRENKKDRVKVLTDYGIETMHVSSYDGDVLVYWLARCNSTYCLRYWNCTAISYKFGALRSCNSAYHLQYVSIE